MLVQINGGDNTMMKDDVNDTACYDTPNKIRTMRMSVEQEESFSETQKSKNSFDVQKNGSPKYEGRELKKMKTDGSGTQMHFRIFEVFGLPH